MKTLQFETWPIDRLIEYSRNPRKNDHAVDKIAGAIKEFGFRVPVVAKSDGLVVDGHLRLKAAKKLGLTEVPVILADDMTEAQIKAFRISVNRMAEFAEWDNELLALEFSELTDMGFDLDLTGFTADEIAALTPEQIEPGLTDEDEVPELPEQPVTVLGDVWVLGGHRLMCGDSTSIDAMDKLMAAQKADMVFTDPPYGMSYDGGRGKKQFGMIKGDDAKGADLIALVRDALATAKSSCKEGASAYVCFPWRTYAEFEDAMLSCGMAINSCIVWDKKSVGLGHQDYRPQHEFIFYSKGGQFYGDRSQSDVWYMSRGSTAAYVHPTQKPVELVEKAIENSSKKGDAVVDCFGGSGSTLIACEKTGRHGRLMELDPKYCDVIVKRWQDFTGKIAIHAETGEPFAEVTNGKNT